MAKALPRVQAKFEKETARTLQVVSATETLWLTAPPASDVRKQLKVPQLEALYESAYLRLFAAWENTVEALVVYYLAGYCSPSYTPAFVGQSPGTTLTAARSALFGGSDFLLWHNPGKVVARVQSILVNCPVETVTAAAHHELSNYAAVRHGIAHASEDATTKFKAAAQALAGYAPTTAGRFLRSADQADPLNPTKWILVIRDRLVDLIGDMTA